LQIIERTTLLKDHMALMSIGMVFILPLAIGFLVVYLAAIEQPRGIAFALFAPAPTVFMCLFIALLVGWEGGFCLLFATPVFLILAALGGLLALGPVHLTKSSRAGTSLTILILLLPMLSGFVESGIRSPDSQRHLHTSIFIRPGAAAV